MRVEAEGVRERRLEVGLQRGQGAVEGWGQGVQQSEGAGLGGEEDGGGLGGLGIG